MTEHDILDAIGDIDPTYLEEAKRNPVSMKIKWMGVGALAACLLLFLIFPFQHYLWTTAENGDYAPNANIECAVYFVQDGALYYEIVGISGGEAEMFEAWARKNGVEEALDLRDISFLFTPTEDDGFDVTVSVPTWISRYFENEDGTLRMDSLKRTIASYRDIKIAVLSIVYS